MQRVLAFGILTLLVSFNALAAEPGIVVDVKFTAGDFKAKTNEISGEAYQQGDMVKADRIVVKLTKLDTGRETRNEHMRDRYLETKKFPEAVMTNAVGRGGKGKGMLKIRGIDKEVSGNFKVEGNQLIADFPVKLSHYNIKGVSYMGVGVDDDIRIHVVVPLKKK